MSGAEVTLEELHDGEGVGRGHEGLALAPHVAAVLDRRHDRRVGGGPADAAFLEGLHERRLGVAGRAAGWRGRRRRSPAPAARPHDELGELRRLVAGLVGVVFAAVAVDGEPARERDGAPRCRPVRLCAPRSDGRSGRATDVVAVSRAVTVEPRASGICDASVRCHTSSYTRRSSPRSSPPELVR